MAFAPLSVVNVAPSVIVAVDVIDDIPVNVVGAEIIKFLLEPSEPKSPGVGSVRIASSFGDAVAVIEVPAVREVVET